MVIILLGLHVSVLFSGMYVSLLSATILRTLNRVLYRWKSSARKCGCVTFAVG